MHSSIASRAFPRPAATNPPTRRLVHAPSRHEETNSPVGDPVFLSTFWLSIGVLALSNDSFRDSRFLRYARIVRRLAAPTVEPLAPARRPDLIERSISSPRKYRDTAAQPATGSRRWSISRALIRRLQSLDYSALLVSANLFLTHHPFRSPHANTRPHAHDRSTRPKKKRTRKTKPDRQKTQNTHESMASRGMHTPARAHHCRIADPSFSTTH